MPPKKPETSKNDEITQQKNIVLTAEQLFQSMLAEIRTPSRDETKQSPVNSFASGSFAKCSARFNAVEKSDVDAFDDTTQTYKLSERFE